jgi:formamidopyrimidine-DNA glycosylase
MPELPEVETVMRGLRQRLEGRTIVRAVAHRPDLRWPLPTDLEQRLTGARVLGFRRRGKYMLMRLSGGASVLLHLGMSGRMLLGPTRPNAPTPHEHLVLETDDGWRVGFVDPRRFGSVDLVPTPQEDSHRLLADLGPEPLDAGFTPQSLSAALAGKRTPIKAALLDQKTVVGVGNIYACEALFLSGVSPRRSAHTVQGARADRLVAALKQVLRRSIDDGGSTLRDHVQPGGELGYFQTRFNVYDRAGTVCPTRGCGRTVRRLVQSGRSTFYCAHCQR